MHTTLLINSSSHSHWETFTSNNVSLNISSHIGISKEFENVVASSATIGSPPMLIENKIIVETTNLVCTFKGSLMVLS
jgi:hypothetical protein